MNRYVVDWESARERASASPDAGAVSRKAPERGARPSRGGGGGVEPSPASPASPGPLTTVAASPTAASAAAALPRTLAAVQRWFVAAVTAPEAEPSAAFEGEAERVLTAGPRLRALERLDIYRRAYHARLIECLTDDYPVLTHALGEASFERLCRAYVEAHPSRSPSLNFFGRHMAAFCRAAPPALLARADFAADLAALEWAIVEVIHAPSSAPLTVEGLREVPMDAWAEARLAPNSAFRLLTFDHPVNAYFQAFREERDPAIPAPARAATAVYRSGPTVWRMDLTPPMHEVLSALASGETLETSLACAESGLAGADDEQAAARVLGWFREWVQSGLFARIDLG